LISSVTYSMPVLGQCTMSLGLRCVRTPILRGPNIEYQHISGSAGFAISFNQIYENVKAAENSTQITVQRQDDSKDSTGK